MLNAIRGSTVDEGSSTTLTPLALQISNRKGSTASQLTYTLTALPAHGQLLHSGNALSTGSSFTQDDIDNSRITYANNGDESATDGFAFTLADEVSTLTSVHSFPFTITPINDNPVLDVYGALNVEENQTITITNGTLRVLDEERSSTLTYRLPPPPRTAA